ncbi:MAG: DUF2147 domain-containing protein [Planktotalea sp.]|uniref:DUF2147 domain-containing protein n=1 Tax=Planktotalea sp. TaxID=2029877 RepID=UPI003C7837BA
MKTLFTAAAFAAIAATSAFADPVYGTWQTTKDDNGNYGLIDVAPCGSKICGTLVKSFDSSGKSFKSANQGRKLIWDMVNTGGGSYGKGKAYSPDRDKTYSGKLKLAGNKLTVQGCVLGVCRDGGTWSKVK